MNSDQAKTYIYLGGAVVAAYLLYKVATGAGKALSAAGDVVGSVASGANDAVAAGVGGIGSVFGLPTPSQTIDDPAVIRYIIDTEGQFEASKRGTLVAYIKAQGMAPGSGHPQSGTAGSALTPQQVKNITKGMPQPTWTPPINDGTGSIFNSGPSFNDAKSADPWGWY